MGTRLREPARALVRVDHPLVQRDAIGVEIDEPGERAQRLVALAVAAGEIGEIAERLRIETIALVPLVRDGARLVDVAGVRQRLDQRAMLLAAVGAFRERVLVGGDRLGDARVDAVVRADRGDRASTPCASRSCCRVASPKLCRRRRRRNHHERRRPLRAVTGRVVVVVTRLPADRPETSIVGLGRRRRVVIAASAGIDGRRASPSDGFDAVGRSAEPKPLSATCSVPVAWTSSRLSSPVHFAAGTLRSTPNASNIAADSSTSSEVSRDITP